MVEEENRKRYVLTQTQVTSSRHFTRSSARAGTYKSDDMCKKSNTKGVETGDWFLPLVEGRMTSLIAALKGREKLHLLVKSSRVLSHGNLLNVFDHSP